MITPPWEAPSQRAAHDAAPTYERRDAPQQRHSQYLGREGIEPSQDCLRGSCTTVVLPTPGPMPPPRTVPRQTGSLLFSALPAVSPSMAKRASGSTIILDTFSQHHSTPKNRKAKAREPLARGLLNRQSIPAQSPARIRQRFFSLLSDLPLLLVNANIGLFSLRQESL